VKRGSALSQLRFLLHRNVRVGGTIVSKQCE
jgi:hypothetical protein